MFQIVLSLIAGVAAIAVGSSLSAVQAKLTREMRVAGPSAGAVVRDLDSGATLFALRADNQRVPASVEKLFVGTATLMRDGAEARIATRAVVETPPVDGVVSGPLYLVGRGDPTLERRAHRRARRRREGRRRHPVEGGVRGDDSAFDHLVGSPDTTSATTASSAGCSPASPSTAGGTPAASRTRRPPAPRAASRAS